MRDNDASNAAHNGLTLHPGKCSAGETLLLTTHPAALPSVRIQSAGRQRIPALPVGTALAPQGRPAHLRIIGKIPLPAQPYATTGFLALALRDCHDGDIFLPSRQGTALAWIILSDKGFFQERADESGPLIQSLCAEHLPLCLHQGFMLPDDPGMLRALAHDVCIVQGYDLVICSGGTGISPRDTTPEALLPLFDRRLHGFEQSMLQTSLAHTPHAAISRAVAGTIGNSLVLALPGSKHAVAQILPALLPAVPHALAKLQGNPADCG